MKVPPSFGRFQTVFVWAAGVGAPVRLLHSALVHICCRCRAAFTGICANGPFRERPKMMDCFDLVVIGCGMIGAAAARHATHRGARVALVGPPERAEAEWGALEIFASHYDEGRIFRKTDPDPLWADLAVRSIDRYPDIAAESGIEFASEVGHLSVAPSGSDTLSKLQQNAADQNVQSKLLDAEGLAAQFPYFKFPPESAAVWEPKSSGNLPLPVCRGGPALHLVLGSGHRQHKKLHVHCMRSHPPH